jgi:hypothetical protein
MQQTKKNGAMSVFLRLFTPSVGPVPVKRDVSIPDKASEIAGRYFSDVDVKKALHRIRAGDVSKVPEALVSMILRASLLIS